MGTQGLRAPPHSPSNLSYPITLEAVSILVVGVRGWCAPRCTPRHAIAVSGLVVRRENRTASRTAVGAPWVSNLHLSGFEACREGLAPGVVPWTLNSLLSRRVEPPISWAREVVNPVASHSVTHGLCVSGLTGYPREDA